MMNDLYLLEDIVNDVRFICDFFVVFCLDVSFCIKIWKFILYILVEVNVVCDV